MNRIYFQDNYCAVVYKYAGEDSQDFFIPLFPHVPFAQAVHRLDKPVSGIILIAFSPFIQTAFSQAFMQQTIQKVYWAICERPRGDTIPLLREEKLEQFISFNKKKQKAFIVSSEIPTKQEHASCVLKNIGDQQAKSALLYWTVCGRGAHYDFIRLVPKTGRTHQIRAQMASIGRSIKGDIKYGAKRSEKGGGIRLHGYKLDFLHPVTQKNITVCAQPDDADSLWTACKDSCLAALHGSGSF